MAKKSVVDQKFDEAMIGLLDFALKEFSNQAKRIINVDVTSDWLQGIVTTEDFYRALLAFGFENNDIKEFAEKLPLISKIVFGLADTVGDILGKD